MTALLERVITKEETAHFYGNRKAKKKNKAEEKDANIETNQFVLNNQLDIEKQQDYTGGD